MKSTAYFAMLLKFMAVKQLLVNNWLFNILYWLLEFSIN